MKEQDHHSVVTHWGGRQERYREFKRTQNRAHDPFGVQPLQFGSDLHYEAWVLERFSPTTKSLTRKPTDVKAVIAGTDRSAKATFVVTRRDDSVDYVFVAKTDASTPAMRALGKIAAANGAQVIVRTRAEIRTRADEFWWWEKLRQVAVLWVRKGSEYDDALVALVATGNRTLAELCSQIDAPRDLIRARLARLHVAGHDVDKMNMELFFPMAYLRQTLNYLFFFLIDPDNDQKEVTHHTVLDAFDRNGFKKVMLSYCKGKAPAVDHQEATQ